MGKAPGVTETLKVVAFFTRPIKGRVPPNVKGSLFSKTTRVFLKRPQIREKTPVKDWSHGGATPLAEVDVNASYTGTVTNVGQCLDVFG